MSTIDERPKIGAIAPWFGGKRTLAPRIVKALGKHAAYWEPFCGGMAVLFSKPRCRLETANDLHGDLINLARVVSDRAASVELYRRARGMFCSDDELSDCDAIIRAGEYEGGMCIERALAYLAVCWMGRNGESGLGTKERAKSLCIRWNNNGGAPATRWQSVVRSIGQWHRRLCGVTITRRDGFEILEKIADEDGTVIYLDPPYLVKSDIYLHDFADADHGRLAGLLKRFTKTRVVVSYYDHPRIAELYPDWNIERIEVNRALSNTSNVSRATELLICNTHPTGQRELFA